MIAHTSVHAGTNKDSTYATSLTPTHPAAYYTEQGVKYFLTMKSSVPAHVQPHYSRRVIRWEWHPWLLLTGYTRSNLVVTDVMLKLYPTTYDTIDCRYFDKQPFCRCHVVFNYSGKRVPIYEEFTFNDKGEITFIEAWSDYVSLIPMNKKDYWAEGNNVKRLSVRVPGLGSSKGLIRPHSKLMKDAAGKDADLADMIHRVKHPFVTYMKELRTHKEDVKRALYPPDGEVYPYYP